ncbi:hypothetical protein ABBQ32_001101 [Trebouxia sp. C0010 RCD-2024]
MPVPTSELTSVESGDPPATDAKHPSGSQDEFIYVPDNFKVKEGARLTERLLVGKPLGVGLQGGVFLLQDNDGNTDPNQVLKAVFKFGIGGFFGMTNLEREWRVGRQLALLSAPGEALPGFMGTGAGVVTKSGKFRAMILERIVGRDITKPIGKTDFHDVHYLRQMLFCTFKAMHQAQRKLAFHHADLRLANIMELLPETDRSHGHTDAPTRTPPSRSGKLQDASVHDMQHASGVLSAADSRATNIQEAATSNQPHPLSAGQSDLLEAPANASQDPVLQHSVEAHDLAGYTSGEKQLNFKIIDFGLADFREVFGAGYVTGGKRTLIHNEPHHAESHLHADSKTQGNRQQEEVQVRGQEGRRVPIRGNKGIAKRSDAVPSGHKGTKFFPTPSNLLPQVPPIERLYRYFWRRKGDVYALLWDMQRYIDGRVWPERDELEVRLMMDFIRHVTGVHVKAWFAPLDEHDKSGNLALK